MSKETKYAKDSVVGIIGKVSQLVGGYGSLWLLTSILSDAAYGGYVAALAVIALVALLAQAGLKQATIQRVGELATDKEQQILTYVG
jgi:O-antigen/teichoic acid export membrane protein